MLNVLSAVTHLLVAPVVPEATDTVRTALREERARWRSQVTRQPSTSPTTPCSSSSHTPGRGSRI
jgi:hypothetical protein